MPWTRKDLISMQDIQAAEVTRLLHPAASGSSAEKGESFLDTAKNIEAMSPDVVVVRHKASGGPALLARHLKCSVVNAGDGAHEHPPQALLALLTIRGE